MKNEYPLMTEHSGVPGTTYGEHLLLGGGSACLNEMVNINEAADPTIKLVTFRGKFQEADAINKNKRSYPKLILDENVRRLTEVCDAKGLVGELDHPSDSVIHFEKASHLITKLWWEGNTLMGEGKVLNTPHGKILRALINDGVRIGISSRGVGTGKVNENGVLVIGENFRLITFDVVADPSTHKAFQSRVSKADESTTYPRDSHSSGIHKSVTLESSPMGAPHCDKDVLLACLGGVIRAAFDQVDHSN